MKGGVTDSLKVEPKNSLCDRRILVFELAVGGHHPVYLRYLVQHWQRERLPGTLLVVVSPDFLERHAEIAAITLDTLTSRIQFIAISAEENAAFKQIQSMRTRPFAAWRLFCRYARQFRATQGMLMSFDSLQLPLLLGEKAPCPVSGIYYAPTFHYPTFRTYQSTGKEKLRQWWQKSLLFCTLKHPQLNTLFCLDRLAIDSIQRLRTRATILPLADPVQIHERDPQAIEQLRLHLGVEPTRQVFLLFGELSRRKGIYQVLEAVKLLPTEAAQKICLILAGPLAAAEKDILKQLIDQVSESTNIQLIQCDRYIKGREVQSFFELADVVLAPYQRHIGMSNILVLAAAFQKAVLVSNYGLMGELTHRYRLGLATDSAQPQQIAETLIRFLQAMPHEFCDFDLMQQFAEQNDAEQFSSTILGQFMRNSTKLPDSFKIH